MRPQQWVKNLFVLAPLVFSNSLTDTSRLPLGLAAMLIFCLLSGAVYLMNDVFDVEKDRAHPTKRNRPIPSGRLPIPVARVASAIFGLGSLTAGFLVDWRLGAVALSYLVVNSLYSWKLKHVVFVDVLIIALGFLLRTMAGAFAIDVYFSEWLFGCTFLLALFLALGKRKHEILQAGTGRGKQRRVLEKYSLGTLNWVLLTCAGLTIAAYTAYTLSVALPGQPLRANHTPFASPWLPVTIPFAVVGITRFYVLISRADLAESPTDRMIRDIPFVTNLGLWGVTVLLLIYLI
jgi:4-hydroxybenzoate polyprenyltransferase